MDDDDAGVLAVADAAELAALALEEDLALVVAVRVDPDSTFISVDLPAPFSPQMAWISPCLTDRLTSCSALTPGNVLVIPLIRKMCSVISPRSGKAPGSGVPGAEAPT